MNGYGEKVLKSKYRVSDLGELQSHSRHENTLDAHNLYISQHTYINDKLVTYDMNECVTLSTPEASVKLAAAQDGDASLRGSNSLSTEAS